MTVADPHEIGCRYCGAGGGEKCHSIKAGGFIPRRNVHAIRRADSLLVEALPGWMPEDPMAEIIDFEAARFRKLAERNGVDLG